MTLDRDIHFPFSHSQPTLENTIMATPLPRIAKFIQAIHAQGMSHLADGDFETAVLLLAMALRCQLSVGDDDPALHQFASDFAHCLDLAGREHDARRCRELFLKALPKADPPRPSLH
jgi:hypothetical protein